jgi:hypothetical protein
MSISRGRTGTLLGLDQPERVEVLRTSSALFHLLGARPQPKLVEAAVSVVNVP